MCVIPLTLKDCAHAAQLHRAAFYKGWTKEDFQDFLRDSLVFGLKIQYPSPAPELRSFATSPTRGEVILRDENPLPLWERVARRGRVRGHKKTQYSSFILWREVADEAEILTLVVDPSLKRKGLGSLLLEALLHRLKAKGINKLFLEVAKDNETAKSFYLKNGFHLIGKRPKYYERPGHTFVDGLNFCRIIKG